MQEESPVRAFAAMKAGEALQPYRFAPGELTAAEIVITITHCGICHSDLHLIDNDWGVSAYPLVPGHEIIGIVSAVGADVTGLRIGQRVGVGWLAGSCMSCEQCLDGNENLCRQGQPTCIGRHGGYATSISVDARFAAPLLCAGTTVFAPLYRYHLRENSRVGVVGSADWVI
jgi:uncharacterized zinc-type alcohol dehydrogenase-like protein